MNTAQYRAVSPLPEGTPLEGLFGSIRSKAETLPWLAAIVESSDDAIISKTLEGCITTWNGGAERLFGFAAAEAIGNHVSMLIPPELLEEEANIIERIKTGGIVDHYRTVRLCKDGRRIAVSVSVSPIKDTTGAVVGASKIARDITVSRRLGNELLPHEANMAAAQHIAHFGSWEMELTQYGGNFTGPVRWSAEMYLIAGLDANGAQVTHDLFFRLVHPDDRGLIRQAVMKAIHDHLPYSIFYRLIRPDGTERKVHEIGQIYYDEQSGHPTKIIGTSHDVTEQRRAEEQLRRHEAMLCSAARIAGLGSWDYDLVQDRLEWSDETLKIFGITREAFPGTMTALLAFVHPDDRKRIKRIHSQSFTSGGIAEMEYRIIRPNGVQRIVYARGETTYKEAGMAIRMAGMIMDITERKQADLRIEYLNRIYALLSAINETIVREEDSQKLLVTACEIAVEKGRFRMAWAGRLDERAQKIVPVAYAGVTDDYLEQVNIDLREEARLSCAYSQALVKGVSLVCNDIETEPAFAPWSQDALRHGYRSSALFPLKVKGRTVGAFEIYAAEAGFFNDQELRLLDQLANDISFALEVHEIEAERLRSQEAVRASEERFRELAENVNEVFWISNAAKTQILYVNPAYETVWGRTCESLLESPLGWEQGIHPEDRERVLQAAATKQILGEYDETYRVLQPDGSVRWIQDRAFPVRGEGGEIRKFVGIARDVTENQRLEENLRQAQKMEAIGQLAGAVAHDFNNILSATLCWLRVMQQTCQLTDDMKETLKDMESEATRGVNLTRQLLLFSRRQPAKFATLDLDEIITELLKMLARLLGQTIQIDFQGAAVPMWVEADASMMEQVIVNLCINARDSMPEGGRLTLSTKLTEVTKKSTLLNPVSRLGTFVCLTVSDNGCGMDETVLKRIFEPFFTTKRAGKGTGLGLATVFGIVKLHRGWIEVDSTVGQGSSFQVYLPAAAKRSPTSAPQGPNHEIPAGSEMILLVEDDLSVRRVAALTLRRLGYAVQEAGDGLEALRIWEQHRQKIELVLTDMIMPHSMSGLDLAGQLKKEKDSLKVIISSGCSPNGESPPLLAGQPITLLQKPYVLAELAKTVRRCLDGT